MSVASAWHFGTFCASMHGGGMLHSMYLLGLHMYHKRSHGGIANKTLLFVGKRMCWIILRIVVIWVFHWISKSKWVLWVRYGLPSSIVGVFVLKDNQIVASQDGSTIASASTTIVPMDTCLVMPCHVVRALLLFHTHAWVLTMEYLMVAIHTLQKTAFIRPRESMLWKVF